MTPNLLSGILGAAKGFFTGGPIGAIAGGIGGLTQGGQNTGSPELAADQREAANQARYDAMFARQEASQLRSQENTTRATISKDGHEALMAVIRNFKTQ